MADSLWLLKATSGNLLALSENLYPSFQEDEWEG